MDTSLTLPVVSAGEMQEFDRMTIGETGIAGAVLMENAGSKTVLAMDECYRPLTDKTVTIISGKGNNGGDGFVIARHLINMGVRVNTFMLGMPEKVVGDAKTNLDILKRNHDVSFITEIEEVENIERVIAKSDIIVDAMLGTGLKSEPAGVFRETILAINQSEKIVVSVDIPSGFSSDMGVVLGIAVKADLTVTFGFPKKGFFSSSALDFTGRIKVVDISIDRSLVEKLGHKEYMITPESIAPILKNRKRDSHKGSFGHVLVVAGAKGKTGAAYMTAVSAARAGAGLVTLVVPEGLEPLMEVKTTEVMTYGLPDEYFLSNKGLEDILNLAEGKSAVVLGPGISTSPETKKLVINLVKEIKSFLIIDADGINILGSSQDILRNGNIVITPHPGEMGRFMCKSSKEVQEDRFEAVRKVVSDLNINVILKGSNTLVGEKGGKVYINPTGNPGMASGGSGDVLAGILAGFISQTQSNTLALCAAVYIHGLAGDLAKEKIGEISMLATDIIEFLPKAIETVKNTAFKYDRFLFEF